MLILIRVAEGDRYRQHFSRGKDFKTLVLTAFFPPFLSPQKEREPPEAFDKRHSAESGGGVWAPRPTRTKERTQTGGQRRPPLRDAAGRAVIWGALLASLTRNFRRNAAVLDTLLIFKYFFNRGVDKRG